MIYKSYLVEENIEVLKNNLVLIYGENLGLINDLKIKILEKNKKSKLLKFNQDEILKKENFFFEELNNKSLFEDKIAAMIAKSFPVSSTFKPPVIFRKISFELKWKPALFSRTANNIFNLLEFIPVVLLCGVP